MVDTSNVFGNGKERRRSRVGIIATLIFVFVLVIGIAIGVTYNEYAYTGKEGPRTVKAGSVGIGSMAYAAEDVPAGQDVTFTVSKDAGLKEATEKEMLMMMPPMRIEKDDVVQYMEDGGDVPEELLERYAATSDKFKTRASQIEEYKTDKRQVMQEVKKRKKLLQDYESAISAVNDELDHLNGILNYINAKIEQEEKTVADLSKNDEQTISEDSAVPEEKEKEPAAGGDAGNGENNPAR